MIYFDNSSTTGYKPQSVINAAANALTYLSANAGRGSHSLSLKAAMLTYKTRQKLCAVFDAPSPERCVFSFNCTDSLNTAILGSFKGGGHIVTTAYEHNSVLRPLHELKRHGLKFDIVYPKENGVICAADIERAIRNDTYMIIVNHISNVNGAAAPIEAIGRISKKYGLLFVVDAAQSAGYLPISLKESNIDYLCFSPHKGLHSTQGLGCLLLSERANPKSTRYGGTGTDSQLMLQPKDLPESLECGTLPVHNIAALNAAISYYQSRGAAASRSLYDKGAYLYERLKAMPKINMLTNLKYSLGSIITFNIQGYSSYAVSDILTEQYDIAVRAGLHCAPLAHQYLNTRECGAVRASLSYDNTFAQIDDFVKAVGELC